MKENSKGSVMPQTNEHSAEAARMPAVALRFSGLALRIMPSTAPGTPNIMHGKKPDM